MGIQALPLASGTFYNEDGGNATPKCEVGSIFVHATGVGAARKFAMIQYVRFDIAVSKGAAMMRPFSGAALTEYGRVTPVTSTQAQREPHQMGFVGITAASITASYYGFVFIHGHIPFLLVATSTNGSARYMWNGATAASGGFAEVAGSAGLNGNGTWSTTATNVFPYVITGNATIGSSGTTAGTALDPYAYLPGVWGL